MFTLTWKWGPLFASRWWDFVRGVYVLDVQLCAVGARPRCPGGRKETTEEEEGTEGTTRATRSPIISRAFVLCVGVCGGVGGGGRESTEEEE